MKKTKKLMQVVINAIFKKHTGITHHNAICNFSIFLKILAKIRIISFKRETTNEELPKLFLFTRLGIATAVFSCSR